MPAIQLLAGPHTLGKAIPARQGAGQPDCQPVVDDGQVQHGFCLAVGIVAQRSLDVAGQRELRPGGFEQHSAAGGVAPEQGALRSLQNLHVGKVIEHPGPGHFGRNFREIGGDGGEVALAGIEHARPLTAQVKRRIVAPLRADVQACHDLAQILDRAQALPLHGIAGQRGDRHRNILQGLFAASGADNDFVGIGICGGLGRSAGQCDGGLRVGLNRSREQQSGQPGPMYGVHFSSLPSCRYPQPLRLTRRRCLRIDLHGELG